MSNNSPEHQRNSLQIKEDDKFYTRLLSKENSVSNPSFRVYYGVASGAVPFLWESQPGTPKHHNMSCTNTLPPLTPPPSYYYNSRNSKQCHSNYYNCTNFMHHLVPKFSLKISSSSSSKHSVQSSKSSNSSDYSSSSSSSSSSSVYSHNGCRRGKFSSPNGSSFSSRGEDEDFDYGFRTSKACFSTRNRAERQLRRCYSVTAMKNMLLSIAGHGSNHHASAANYKV